MANRQYSADQRAWATRQVIDRGQSAAMVAREMSVSVTTVQRWITEALAQHAATGTLPTQATTVISRTAPPDVTTCDTLEQQLNEVHRRLDELETQLARYAEST